MLKDRRSGWTYPGNLPVTTPSEVGFVAVVEAWCVAGVDGTAGGEVREGGRKRKKRGGLDELHRS